MSNLRQSKTDEEWEELSNNTQDKPKFKVGDIVRTIRRSGGYSGEPEKGYAFEIQEFYYNSIIEKGNIHRTNFYPKNLELITKAEDRGGDESQVISYTIDKEDINQIEPLVVQQARHISVNIEENSTENRGIKETTNKPSFKEIDWDFIIAMSNRMDKEDKYPPNNWKKGIDVNELVVAIIRHAIKILQPVEGDEEDIKSHLTAIGTNCQMAYYQIKDK